MSQDIHSLPLKKGFTLQVKQLVVRKSGYTLLNEVSFDIAGNEFVAILGANGAGKTTLLRAIAGERPYSGSICIDGHNLYDNPEEWFQQIGQVPIENVLHERLPVIVALSYMGRLRNIPGSQLKDKISHLLDQFALTHKANAPIYQLSSGERKKANICAELLTEPRLLLLDEPTTNLDPDAERALMKQLAQLAQQGTTILIVSHTVSSLNYCDRVIFMGNSEITGILKPLASQGFRESSDWVWSSEEPEAYDQKIPHAKFFETLVKKFEDYKTQPRYPSPNPRKSKNITLAGDIEDLPQTTSKLPHQTEEIEPESSLQPNKGKSIWPYYRIVLFRQLALLYYEGWRIPIREAWDRLKVFLGLGRTHTPLIKSTADLSTTPIRKRNILDRNWHIPLPMFVPTAFGIFAGILLSMVLPAQALIQSENKGLLDPTDASQASFFIGLMAFMIGLLGSFREIVREINIYQHERLKALPVSSYLLVKFTTLGLLYGVIGPVVMFTVLASSQDLPPPGLLLGGEANILLSILLAGLAGVALGLAISSIGSTGEWATALMGGAFIANALLSGLVTNKLWEDWIDSLSVFVSSRWAMESVRTATEVYCWGFQRVIRDHYSPAHLLSIWLALLAHILAALLIAYVALHRKDTWFKPLQRLRPLISQGHYVYSVVAIIIILLSLSLYRWTQQAHEADLMVSNVGTSFGLQQFAAAQCVEEQAPTQLADSQNIPEESGASLGTPMVTPFLEPEVNASPSARPITPSVINTPEPTFTPVATKRPPISSTGDTLPQNDFRSISPTASATSTATPEPTPTPTLTPIAPYDPKIEIATQMDLYFGPAIRSTTLTTLAANTPLTLLSQATLDSTPWMRVEAADDRGRHYVGWVEAAESPLRDLLWQVSDERKAPPTCVAPIASSFTNMRDVDPASGKLGTWASDGAGNVAIVVDLFRSQEGIGELSERLMLQLQLNNAVQREIPIEPQKKRFILQNGVYNLKISSGDNVTLLLAPARGETTQNLHGHVAIFFVPDDCEFGEG